MDIGNQLKKYRKELNISQEILAEEINVSRQTISNWENDKTYPDIQSLVLISEYFKISLDELIKGDVINMKNQLERSQLEKKEVIRNTKGMVIGLLLTILILPVIKVKPVYGFIAMSLFFGFAMWCAIKVERFKKHNNIRKYKEIVDYFETGKMPIKEKQDKESILSILIKIVVSGVITGILALLVITYI